VIPVADIRRTRIGRHLIRDPRRPWLVLAVALGLEAAAGAGLVVLVGGLDRLLAGLHENLPWFALCLAAEAVAYLGYALAFREVVIVRRGPRLGLGSAAAVVGAGFAPVLTADAWGGFSVDRAALEEMGLSREDAVARVLALNGLEYVLLAPAALASAMLLVAGVGGDAPASITLPWLAFLPGALVAVALTTRRPRTALRRRRSRGRVSLGLARAVDGLVLLRAMVTAPGRHGLGLLGAALYWAGDIAVLWAALRAFGVEPSVPALILAFATGYALTRRALPAGGPGAVPLLLSLALHWVGVPFGPAILAVFVYRAFTFWLALLPGLLVVRRLDHVQRVLAHAGTEHARRRGRAGARRRRTATGGSSE
jgi:uncharacterized membrane protein YbhN (UPF0104 family)